MSRPVCNVEYPLRSWVLMLSRAHSLCTNKLIPIQWSTSMVTRQDSKARTKSTAKQLNCRLYGTRKQKLPRDGQKMCSVASATVHRNGVNRTDTRHPGNGGDYYFRWVFFLFYKNRSYESQRVFDIKNVIFSVHVKKMPTKNNDDKMKNRQDRNETD